MTDTFHLCMCLQIRFVLSHFNREDDETSDFGAASFQTNPYLLTASKQSFSQDVEDWPDLCKSPKVSAYADPNSAEGAVKLAAGSGLEPEEETTQA